MGNCLGLLPLKNAAAAHQQARPQTRRSRRLDVALRQTNTANEPPPTVYYVIIGCGPMAVVNHITLRHDRSGERRIADKDILHIGFPNPWPKYFEHGLGQPPHLLSFPGFDNNEMTGELLSAQERERLQKDSGLNSQHFGRRIDAELLRLFPDEAAIPPNRLKKKWVALIQARDPETGIGSTTGLDPDAFKGERPDADHEDHRPPKALVLAAINEAAQRVWPDVDAPYRLCLYDASDRTCELVYASHIDICTGPGRPQVLPISRDPNAAEDPQMLEARTPPWISPEDWTDKDTNRRVMNGVDAIRDESQWNAGERICITAGGGVGLNAAEKARDNQCFGDWFGRSGLTPILLNPRNRTFLQLPKTHPRWRVEYKNLQVKNVPANVKTLFLRGLEMVKQRKFKTVDLGEPFRREAFDLGDLYDRTSISEDQNEARIFPATGRARMGRKAVLTSVSVPEADAAPQGNKVKVELGPYGGGPAQIRDCYQRSSTLTNGSWDFSDDYLQNTLGEGAERITQHPTQYDRLVIPNGQQSNTVGQPIKIAKGLTFEPLERQGRMVCLQTADTLVRILGAANNNYPGVTQANWNNGTTEELPGRMWEFHATLPKCAVPDGFIICAINTAVANGYFADENNAAGAPVLDRPGDPGPPPAAFNSNINTMTHAEVACVLGEDKADRIIEWRNELNGYANLIELVSVLTFETKNSRRQRAERLHTAQENLRAKNGVLFEVSAADRDADEAHKAAVRTLTKARAEAQATPTEATGAAVLAAERAVEQARLEKERVSAENKDVVDAAGQDVETAEAGVASARKGFDTVAAEMKKHREAVSELQADADAERWEAFPGRPGLDAGALAGLVNAGWITFAYPTLQLPAPRMG